MTRARAIEILKNTLAYDSDFAEAKQMAIEALEKEPIIHCKECKHWQEWENGTGACRRSMIWVGTDYDDYCSFAEQKESDAE